MGGTLMSGRVDGSDAAFEVWVAGAMRELRPVEGSSDALSARVLAIPDGVRRRTWLGRVRDGQSGVLVVAGLATAFAGVLLWTSFRLLPSRPGAIVSPAASFDPSIVGPGIVTSMAPSLEIARWVVAGLIAFFALRLLLMRRAGSGRPLVLGGLGLLLAYVASPVVRYDPGLENGSFDALPLGFGVDAPEGPFETRDVWYETADPAQPTTIVISLRNAGPVPVRFEGIVGDLGDVFISSQPWKAVWLGPTEDHGSVAGMERASPFAPTTIAPGAELEVFLVGRAGPCAYGSTFHIGDDAATGSLHLSPLIEVAYSVFGLLSTTSIEPRLTLAEPQRANCPTP
jgi:hypothetical protein